MYRKSSFRVKTSNIRDMNTQSFQENLYSEYRQCERVSIEIDEYNRYSIETCINLVGNFMVKDQMQGYTQPATQIEFKKSAYKKRLLFGKFLKERLPEVLNQAKNKFLKRFGVNLDAPLTSDDAIFLARASSDKRPSIGFRV
jgi:hypothetical protein